MSADENSIQETTAVTREEALTVHRPESPMPYVWPDPVQYMVSDTYKFGFSGRYYDGDPFACAVALEMLRALYDNGYALVKVGKSAGGVS